MRGILSERSDGIKVRGERSPADDRADRNGAGLPTYTGDTIFGSVAWSENGSAPRRIAPSAWPASISCARMPRPRRWFEEDGWRGDERQARQDLHHHDRAGVAREAAAAARASQRSRDAV